jgi:6-phosphogluconolactonase (cycloisomerase 2 family)
MALLGPGRASVVAVACALVALLIPVAAQASRNLYVANSDDDEIEGFSLSDSGQLTQVAGIHGTTGDLPRSTAITPDGRHLYVADTGGTTISAFSVAAADGALTPIAGPFSISGGGNPQGIAISPDGHFLYAAVFGTDKVAGFSIAADGSLTAVSGGPFNAGPEPISVAISPDGDHVYVVNNETSDLVGSVSAYTIAADGSLTAVTGSPFPTGETPVGIAITPDGGNVYVTGSGEVSAYSIGSDGALTTLTSALEPGGGQKGISISPDGEHAFVANLSLGSISAFDIADDGTLNEVEDSPFDGGDFPIATAITPDGRHLYVANNVVIPDSISAFDIAETGALAEITNSPFNSGGDFPDREALAITPNQAPVADFTTAAGDLDEPVSFDASASGDPDGSVETYEWDFGDGTSATESDPLASHSYPAIGTYDVTLTVTDNEGCAGALIFTGQTAYCNGVFGGGAASRQVTVDGEVLNPRVSVPKSLKLKGKKLVIHVKAGADEAVDVLGAGTIGAVSKGKGRLPARKGGKGFRLKAASASAAPGKRVKLALKPAKKSATKKISKLLGKGRKLRANLSVTLTDEAGNSVIKTPFVKLKLKKKPKG